MINTIANSFTKLTYLKTNGMSVVEKHTHTPGTNENVLHPSTRIARVEPHDVKDGSEVEAHGPYTDLDKTST